MVVVRSWADGARLVVLDLVRHVLLRVMNINSLPLSLPADLVEVVRASTFGAAAAETLWSCCRGARRAALIGVVNAADHEGAVGSPSTKSTPPHCPMRGMWIITPVLAGPRGGDAQPAGAVGVRLAIAVPVEMHLDAAVLIGVDLFAGGPTTTAVCTPARWDGVTMAGRKGRLAEYGMALKRLVYLKSPVAR